MRILCVDQEIQGLDFCLRAIADGHDVRLWRPTKNPVGKGFAGLKIVDDWRASMVWAREGLVLMTGNAKYCMELDRFRPMGWNIFGPTEQSAALETDREAGMKAMEAVGLELPHYECFGSLAEARAFAKSADQAYVFKPLGSEDNKALTYVASDPADMVGWIDRQIARGMKVSKCMLQEKIDMAAELGVSGWVGPEGFLPNKWQICFEGKKLMPGDYGPNTGEMHTTTQYVTEDRMAEEMLLPLEPILRTLGHRGDFSIGCGVDSKGRAWPFEFTARCGWPAFYIQTASHKGDVAEWMLDLCKGEDSLRVDKRVAIGALLCQPPFPQWNGKPEDVNGNPISGLDDVWDDFHPSMIQMAKGPMMEGGEVSEGLCHQTAGEQIGVVTGLGKTVSEAREAVTKTVKAISFSDMMVRNDYGLKQEKELPILNKFGYATSMEF